jgi:hypothetical protein
LFRHNGLFGVCPDQMFMQPISLSHPTLDQVTVYGLFKPALRYYEGGLKRKGSPYLFRLRIGQPNRIRLNRTAIPAEEPADLLAGLQPLFVMEFIGQEESVLVADSIKRQASNRAIEQ